MITTIFKKSKPINLVISAFIILLGFSIVEVRALNFSFGNHFFTRIIAVLAVMFSVLVVDFIVKKNSISEKNSFVILFFSLFFFFYWDLAKDNQLVFSNLFILLALRKIISLKSQILVTKKIFDAAFWISIATLFSFWSILFLLVLYLGILIYASNYYKHFLVPLVSVFIVFIIVNSYHLFFYDTYFHFLNDTISLDFKDIFTIKKTFAVVVFLIMILISAILFLPSIKNKTQKNKSSYYILLMSLIIALIISIITPNKGLGVLIYAYFPLAALFTVVYERLKNRWLISGIIYLLIILSTVFLFI